MLGKLLKYDLKSVGKYWWIIMLVMLGLFGAAGVSFGSLQLLIEDIMPKIQMDSSALGVALSIALNLAQFFLFTTFAVSLVGVGACGITVSVLIYVRFFKHLFTDEGYLTFTLPVSRGQIFNAKVINAVIWTILTAIISAIGSSFMTIIMSLRSITLQSDFGAFVRFLSEIPFTQWLWFGVWTVIGLLISIAGYVLGPCAAYFCITLGATVFKRAKLIASIGIYLLMLVLSQLFTQAAAHFGIFYLIFSSMGIVDILSKATELGLNALVTAIMLIVLGVTATLAAFFYSITRNILERKLNLA